MKSCIYEGQVRHRRFSPRRHEFDYRLYMMFIDLDELPKLFNRYWLWSSRRFNFAWFRRSDHLNAEIPSLRQAVSDKLYEHTGKHAEGPIRLLTHCRYFGFGFNPVSFYYCYDSNDTHVQHIVAEVNNTPWGEQYCYVLSDEDNVALAHDNNAHKQFKPVKDFHVSPFMPMNIDYDWRFNQPDKHLAVHMQNFIDEEKLFDATLNLKYKPINSATMARVLIQYPLITVKIVAGIYFEAFRLLLKRIPILDHPANNENLQQRGKS